MGGPAFIDGEYVEGTDNFLHKPFVLDGLEWPTCEHYFQWAKFCKATDECPVALCREIQQCPSAGRAWQLGQSRRATLRSDWERVKANIMYRAVKAGLSIASGVNGVLLDRILGLSALLVLVAITQPWLYDRVDETAARLTFAAVIVAGVVGVTILLFCNRLPAVLMKSKLMRGLAGLSTGLNDLILQLRLGLPVFGLSIFGHLLMVAASFVLAQDLGLSVTFVDCLVLVPGVMLLAAAPISIAGWGVREAVMVAAMSLLGVPDAGSTSLSLVFGALIAGIGLVGGILCVANPNRRVSALETIGADDTEQNKAKAN